MHNIMNVKNPYSKLASALARLSIACFIGLLITALLPFQSIAQIPEGIRTVRPVEIDDVLLNPGIGFSTFQMFNGDNHAANQDVLRVADLERYRNDPNDLDNNHHPATTLAYFRILWKVIEPRQEDYQWDYLDELLKLARSHGQTLILRISPYKGKPIDDVPSWYRELVGEERDFQHIKWVVDPENPLYAECFGNMIRELGKRYDGHPDLEGLDLSFIGWAGEGGGTELLSTETMKNLIDPYLESFRKTPLIVLLHGKEVNEYIISNATVGWRQDCLGDLGFWAEEQNGWTHMYDYYPQTIANYNMQDAWKKAHVSFEICGTFPSWKENHGYGPDEVKYIIEQSLKWHISSFNAKSSQVPEEWEPLINSWLKKMGYRFVLRKFSYPASVRHNGKFSFQSWWENKGVAPCYGNYVLTLRLVSGDQEIILPTNANIKDWLPGDIVYEDAVFIPRDAKPGIYELQIGILDRLLSAPRIRLANGGKTPDGWYILDKLEVY
jgi:hypothetical protein